MAWLTILAGSVAALLYLLHLSSIALTAFRCRRGHKVLAKRDGRGISLVRPVCGIESHSWQTLSSSFQQDHQPFEVIFCAAREDDAILPLLRRLIEDHPDVHARILFGEDRLGQNPKLNNMAKGWREAAFDTVVFADSNLLLPRDYCAQVLGAFDEQTGVVSSPPVGSDPEGFWGEVECAILNTHAARWQYAADAMGLSFAQGKTLAFRRNEMSMHLMRALAEELAEDAAATKLARRTGKQVRLLAPPFSHPVGRRSVRAVWNRHVRWARLRRATFPLLFSVEIFTGLLIPLAAFTSVFASTGAPVLPTIFAGLILWYVPELALARTLGWHVSRLSPASWLMRDLLLPAFYVSAWTSEEFVWNGHRMSSAKEADESAGLEVVSELPPSGSVS